MIQKKGIYGESMKFFNSIILVMSLAFGLLMGAMDAFFDWMFHYDGGEPYLIYVMSEFPGHEVVWRGTFLVLALFFGMFFSAYYNRKSEAQAILDNVFDNVIPICITSNDYDIILANRSYYKIFGIPEKTGDRVKCFEHRPGPICKTEDCPVVRISSRSTDLYSCESNKAEPGKPTRTFIVTATPYHDTVGRPVGIIETFQDITARKELEDERERLVTRLNSALTKVKKLSGFLPICAQCKKVRDDKGFWKQVESYVSEHSEAEFSHSICPECASRYYKKLST